jgi:hypothetical protein
VSPPARLTAPPEGNDDVQRKTPLRTTRSLLACLIGGATALLLDGHAGAAAPPSATPISGVVRAGGATLAGVTVVVRAVTRGGRESTSLVKTESDGTFVIPGAPPGLYTLLAAVPGFPFAVVRVLHSAAPDAVSFVSLDLPPAPGVLPDSPRGKSDPWNARATTRGDVLRDVAAILAALDEPPPPAAAVLAAVKASATKARLPVGASVASTAGFGAAGGAALSETAVDITGALGGSVRWGIDGHYSRLDAPEGGSVGDASRVALDLSAGDRQNLRLATRREVWLVDESDAARFAAHTLDWAGATGDRSQANVSARLVTQSNAFHQGPVANLFARSSDEMDVFAGYRTDFDDRYSIRLSAAYRHAAMPDSAGTASLVQRETRVGAVGGAHLLPALSLEAGATGDVSDRTRGITPEVTLTVHPGARWRFFVTAARRIEQRLEEETPYGQVSADEADLTRITGSVWGGGLRYDGPSGEAVVFEASRRDITGIHRLLLDPDFFGRLDSLYFLPGDVATQLSSSVSGRVARGLEGRLAARVGRVAGERDGAIRSDEAAWGAAEAGLRVGATGTTISLGYRYVSQLLQRGDQPFRNDLAAVNFVLSQAIPVPLLRALASEWRALLSVELGRRRDGEEEEKSNRRLAGGFAVSF